MRRFILLAALAAAFVSFDAHGGDVLAGHATRIVDGDTFLVGKTRVRVWGNNTPERDQCGYGEATQALRTLLKGKPVLCRVAYLDIYNRSVARCTVEGTDLGALMVGSGYSRDFERYSGGYYAAIEDAAREKGRGLWRTCWTATQ